MELGEKLREILADGGARIVRYVDISGVSEEKTRGYSKAILLCIPLEQEYLKRVAEKSVVDGSEFSTTEHAADQLAERAAAFLTEAGFPSYAQSEHNLGENGEFDSATKRTPLPHKTIAVLSGIGWIGKNNLLITKEYGCAICMCTVLTNAPLPIDPVQRKRSKCANCSKCQKICPAQVIHGVLWSETTDRDEIVNIYQCETCLKCMTNCVYTQSYRNR